MEASKDVKEVPSLTVSDIISHLMSCEDKLASLESRLVTLDAVVTAMLPVGASIVPVGDGHQLMVPYKRNE